MTVETIQPVVLLHVGSHKTGTTSLQQALVSFEDELFELGWLYPKKLRSAWQHFRFAYDVKAKKMPKSNFF